MDNKSDRSRAGESAPAQVVKPFGRTSSVKHSTDCPLAAAKSSQRGLDAQQMSTSCVIDELWDEFKRTGARHARDRLILHYSPLVKRTAGRISAGLPRTIERADLESYGMFGLIDAIDRFDPTRNRTFESYAFARIRGSMIDELRSNDWIPRSVRSEARTFGRAQVELGFQLSRTPTDAEVAAELGVSDVNLRHMINRISFVRVCSLDEILACATGERNEGATVSDHIRDPSEDPSAGVDTDDTKRLLADAINCLTEREMTVVTLYYSERLTLARIGELLGVTEGRVCQIRAKAVLRLRLRLRTTLLAAA